MGLRSKEYVIERKQQIKEQVTTFERKPKLCVIQVGDNPASSSYIKGKRKDCEEVGIDFEHIHIENIDDENVNNDYIRNIIKEKNKDENVDGLLLQLPLPNKFNEPLEQEIDKEKDVDGFRKDSEFIPCTPKGIIDYLINNNVELCGKVCVVVGRSNIVGKPLVQLLIDKGATVISCNSKTPIEKLKKYSRECDIFVSAIGKANYFTSEFFNLDNKKQILIDVGINRNEQGKLCGDIMELVKVNPLSTPVPNGVGLFTRVSLLENTIQAYLNRK